MKKLAQMVSEYVKLRDEKAKLAEEIKDINSEMEALAADFVTHFDKEECSKATYRGYTVYKSEADVFPVKDWDAFFKYAVDTGQSHLIQRRPSLPACRELYQMKGKIPGLEKFNKITIGVIKA